MRSLYHERQAPSEAPIRRFGGVVEVGAEVGGRLRHRDAENAAGTPSAGTVIWGPFRWTPQFGDPFGG